MTLSESVEELIVCATGGRCDVVEKLDALVKGYRPDFEFHGVPVPAVENPRTGTFLELPLNRDRPGVGMRTIHPYQSGQIMSSRQKLPRRLTLYRISL